MKDVIKTITDRLDHIDELSRAQAEENEKLKERVEFLEKYYQVTYEFANKHKQENVRYKKACGPLPSKEGKRRDNSRG